MKLETKDSPVIEKTKELCQTLLDQPTFKDIRTKIDAFAANQPARDLYSHLCDLQEMLQEKETQGVPLSEEEVDNFETQREALFENPLARDFVEAQQSLHKLQETIGQYISKTFKLGRVPTEADFEKGACGPSCSCNGG